MGFFDKKKKGDTVRPLTEKEIQDKLYGVYRSSRVMLEDPIEEKKPSFVSQTAALPKKTFETKPAESADLFKRPAVEFAPEEKTEPLAAPAEPRLDLPKLRKKEKEFKEQVSEWTDEENESVLRIRQEELRRHRKKVQAEAQKKMADAFTAALKRASSKIPSLLQAGIGNLIGLLMSIDFRKPAVRHAAYWFCALGFLSLIFSGIHYLNVQRETAMKMSPKKHAKAEVASPALSVPAEENAAAKSAVKSSSKESRHKETAKIREKESSRSAASNEAPAQTLEKREGSSLEESPLKPADKAEKKEVPAVRPPAPMGHAIQVATYAAEEDASRLVAVFQGEKFPTFMKALNRPNGKVYYCVFIGPFKNRAEAERQLSEFKKKNLAKPFQDAFIRQLKDSFSAS